MVVTTKDFTEKRSFTAQARTAPKTDLAGPAFILHFIDKSGIVNVARVADTFRMTKGQLAETVGLAAATISKADRREAPKTQSRVREMLEILAAGTQRSAIMVVTRR